MNLLTALLLLQEAPSAEEVYKKTPQAELKIQLWLPAAAGTKRPAIVFFFGGGWTSGNIGQFAKQAAYLARRGMVAACADYRVKSRHGVTPDACVEDAKSAVRWLRANAERWGVDPARIAAAGGSAGGHLAACTGIVPGLDAPGEDVAVSSRPDALVLFNPVLHGDPLVQRLGDPEKARAITPNAHLRKELPPALIHFGTNDALKAGAEEYLAKSKELGFRAEILWADGQPHGFFNKPPWMEKTLRRTDEFLISLGWLSGKPELGE